MNIFSFTGFLNFKNAYKYSVLFLHDDLFTSSKSFVAGAAHVDDEIKIKARKIAIIIVDLLFFSKNRMCEHL